MTSPAHLSQIAFSVLDVKRSHNFYRSQLGFEPAGGTASFRGPVTSEMLGLPDAAAICWWMVDQRDFMQLEMFQFEKPVARPLPADWRPCDIGYNIVGVHVDDFDGTVARINASGGPSCSDAVGQPGFRRVCLRDPDGVPIELMEDDPRPPASPPRRRPAIPVVTRSVTLVVPDLARARRFWVDTLELTVATDVVLHGPEHEVLWGLPGASRNTLLLWADDFLIELVSYTNPASQPWPQDYRITDQGILNIALGYRDLADLRRVYERVLDAGYRCNRELLELGAGGVVYCNDDQGFSVELLCSSGPAMDEQVGFEPRPAGTLTSSGRLSG